MRIELDRKRYQELQKNAQRVKGILSTDAPVLTAASVAIIGRRDIDNKMTSFMDLGHSHFKVRKDGSSDKKVWSEKNELGAWASTNRTSGGRPWMLSRYSWETKKAQSRKKALSSRFTAVYTNTLANLHTQDTKPYSAASPHFEAHGKIMRIGKGSVRKGKAGIWAMIGSELNSAVDPAIARAERKLLKDVVL